MIGAIGTPTKLLMKLKMNPAFSFICALFVTASAMGQLYEFEFTTTTPGFSGELFFNTPSGIGTADVLAGNSFITTPDGTFTVSKSFAGGPVILNPPPSIVWGPGGFVELDVNLYEYVNSQLYNWVAAPTSIGDTPAAAIPAALSALDPSASGTWVYVGAVPEPSTPLLMAIGLPAMFAWRGCGSIRRC
jgi:hypothetical protein